MLGQRRRRWPNIETTLGERLVFAGILCAMDKANRSPLFLSQGRIQRVFHTMLGGGQTIVLLASQAKTLF